MTAPVARVRVPKTAAPGEVMTLRAVLVHPMETGLRRDASGVAAPRRIVHRFEVAFEGRPVLTADLEPSVSANPFIEFHVRASESGTFRFSWVDDDGSVYTAEEHVTVV